MTAFHSALIESTPTERPETEMLLAVAALNSFTIDYIARPQIGAHLSAFILDQLPWATFGPRRKFLIHQALRLVCQDRLFAPLWKRHLGGSWEDVSATAGVSVVVQAVDRWRVRAAMDAVVADAYGLDRDHFEHVLASFGHRSYPKAPELCVAALDELQAIGLEAFCRRHDPYWDIPLNESLPEPAIDFPDLHTGDGSVASIERGGQLTFVPPDYGPLFRTESVVAERSVSAKSQLPPLKPAATADSVYESIVELLSSKGVITSIDVQTHTGLLAEDVRPHLRRLVDDGHAVTEGQRRGTRYRRRLDV
jgi:hypothetical protein